MYDEKCLSRVGRNVRALRLAAQMGQEELAEKLGVSQTHMSNMECGRVSTSIRGLIKLANIFDCSLDVLLDKKAALKLAAKRTEAYLEYADDDEAELAGPETEGQPAGNGGSSAEIKTGSVYSWEDVRQLLELLHKAQADVPAVKPVQQKTAAAPDQKSKQKTTAAAPKTATKNTKPQADPNLSQTQLIKIEEQTDE